MRSLRFVLPALLLASLAVPVTQAAAAPPTQPASSRSHNTRVTLYTDGQVTAVLMFYRTQGAKQKLSITSNSSVETSAKTIRAIRAKGNVSIKWFAEGKKDITLTADEALIETIPDQPLPINF